MGVGVARARARRDPRRTSARVTTGWEWPKDDKLGGIYVPLARLL